MRSASFGKAHNRIVQLKARPIQLLAKGLSGMQLGGAVLDHVVINVQAMLDAPQPTERSALA